MDFNSDFFHEFRHCWLVIQFAGNNWQIFLTAHKRIIFIRHEKTPNVFIGDSAEQVVSVGRDPFALKAVCGRGRPLTAKLRRLHAPRAFATPYLAPGSPTDSRRRLPRRKTVAQMCELSPQRRRIRIGLKSRRKANYARRVHARRRPRPAGQRSTAIISWTVKRNGNFLLGRANVNNRCRKTAGDRETVPRCHGNINLAIFSENARGAERTPFVACRRVHLNATEKQCVRKLIAVSGAADGKM